MKPVAPITLLCVATSLAGVAYCQAPRTTETVRVEGRVVDLLGDAVPLAQVVATTPRSGKEIARVQADGDGAFVIPNLPRRELVLRAVAARRIGDPCRLDLDESPWSNVAELPVQLQMIDAATVRGSVKDENGKPLAAVRVIGEVRGDTSPWRAPRTPFVETDAAGKFELPVPFGRSTVCAFAPNRDVALEHLTLDDDQVADFVLRSSPSCELRIHYRGAKADDLDWMAFCDAGDSYDRLLGRAFVPDLWQIWPQTRKDEVVTFHGLPIASKLTKFRLFFVPANIENTSYVVPQTPGQHDVEAPTGPWVKENDPLVELRGRLVDTDGKPIRHARLTRWVSPQRTDVAETDDDGKFQLALRSTLPSVWIELEGEDYVPVSPRNERHAGDYAFDMFDVPTGERQDVALVAEKAAAITGRFLDDSSRPIWGARIQIHAGERDWPSNSSVSTLTDRDGRFALRGLRASSRFHVWLRATSAGYEFATEKLPLRVGETLALGVLQAGKPNVIEGELPDDSGASRAGVPLELSRDTSARAYERWHHSFTDRLGRFRFAGLPEGSYTIHLGHFPGRGFDWPVIGKATVEHGSRVVIDRR